MAEFVGSHWLFLAVGLLFAFVGGGFVSRMASPQQPQSAVPQSPDSTRDHSRLSAMQAELSEAREEAELTLLQLHQVQEELERYFLLYQDLRGADPLQPHQRPRLRALLARFEAVLQQHQTRQHSLLVLLVRQQRAIQRAGRLICKSGLVAVSSSEIDVAVV